MALGYHPTKTALFRNNPKRNSPYCEVANTARISKSFGGRLAQIRAIQAWNSERRARSSAGEFDRGECALAGPEHKRARSSHACRSRGERAGGVGAGGFR